MINRDELKKVLIKAESENDLEARSIVHHTLAPYKTDSVEEIQEKILLFIRLMYGASLTFDDAPYHKEIDKTFAEQIHSYLNFGVPKYKGIIIAGFRESAKSARVRMNESYLNCYLKDIIDYINIVSEDGESSKQFVMDMFNAFAISKITKYFDKLISGDFGKDKKESQTMSKFTTTTGITYSASSARKTKRGSVKQEIDEVTKEISTKRPKQTIFDDIENEVTVRSFAITEHIYEVVNATLDGMDQVYGFWILLGNVLSIRGIVSTLIKKYCDDDSVKIIEIPIYYTGGVVAWPAKYCMTDKEQKALAKKGVNKVSIETLRRNSDNFETEFLNNPKRSKVYFTDNVIKKIDEADLVDEKERVDNLLIIEEPTPYDIYAIGVDTAKGVNKDQSAFTVFKTTGNVFEEVANYKNNKIPPEEFSPFVINIAEKYNHAFIIPENNFPGNEFILFMKNNYNNFYINKEKNNEIGVNTNLKTKPEMFLRAKTLLLDGLVRVRSKILYYQIMEYPSDEVEFTKKDESGGHFDLLMSAIIALYKIQQNTSIAADIPDINYDYQEANIYNNL